MLEAKIVCDKNFKIGNIDPRLYGSFLEHMGRVIYTDVYKRQAIHHPKDGRMGEWLLTTIQMNFSIQAANGISLR